MKELTIGGSPHIKGSNTTKRIMIDVLIALLPASIVGILFFGYKALIIIFVSVLSAIATEIVYKLCVKKSFKEIYEEFDFTSAITGLLIGLCMPPLVNWYIPIFASAFAVAVVKMLFGGTGKNLVNPAIVGRIFVALSFGIMLNGFTEPLTIGAGNFFDKDALAQLMSGATPLTQMIGSDAAIMPGNLQLFLGNIPGTIGETSALALLIGGIYLSVRKVIDFRFPLIYICVTGLVSVLLYNFNFAYFLPSVLSGGLMIGAIFMATDYTTSPNSFWGNIIYFSALGLLTAILRFFTGTEVVSYAILLMNLTVPLIDKYVFPRPFGYVKEKKIRTKNIEANMEVKK